MRHVIALDVGGTGMKAALIGLDGTPLYEEWRPAVRERGPEAAVESALRLAEDLRTLGRTRFGATAEAVGVAVPGAVDTERDTTAHTAGPGRHDVPLRELLSRRLDGMPVALGHGARAGGLAEGRLGAGRGVGRFLFVSLGTGITGAIGIDGRVEAGAHGRAGELGHVVVRPGGPACGCGGRGCLETLASAAAIGRAWAATSGDPSADAADCARAVDAGDETACGVWRAAVAALADGLLTAVTVLNPRTLIIGGSLAEAGDTLLTPLRVAVAERVTFQRLPTIVPAALGDAAGCLGAGLLARDLVATASAPHRADRPTGR
ncbi:ROK family protein [Streptomyces cinereoruber]|uniref:ROK family protein n=1 Tax=Streptomyces cinereoruber TaxID=67260 RepID=UPI00363257A9